MLENTEHGPRFMPEMETKMEVRESPQEGVIQGNIKQVIPPHPAKGEYGPILNYLFGEKIEQNKDPRLAPIVDLIQEKMRGKSGFVKLGNNVFYKNGSMIEAVMNPNSVPEGITIKDLTKFAQAQ